MRQRIDERTTKDVNGMERPRERKIKWSLKMVCLYGHTYNKRSIDQPGLVASPARGQLNRENVFFPVPVRA